jgi:hypothetical protein
MRTYDILMYFHLITFTLVQLFSPTIPPFLGYFVYRVAYDYFGILDIHRHPIACYLLRFTTSILSLPLYLATFSNAGLVGMCEVFPSLIFQTECLLQFGRDARHSSHENHSTLILNYRSTQLLNHLFNSLYSTDFFAICTGIGTFVVIICGYVLITTIQTNSFQLIVACIGSCIVIIEYLLITIVLSMASKVWTASVAFRSAWKSNPRLASKRIARMCARSMPNLKVKIGCTNFVERNTPFILFAFCVEQTISLVLLNK